MNEPDRPSWRNVWVLSLTIVCTITSIYSWNHLRSLHLRGLGASETQIGWGFFFLTLAYRAPQVLGGLLADRFGRKAIVVLGTFGMSAAYVGMAEARRWELVIAAICACWTIGALQWPALVSLVADSVPEGRRGRAMGLLEACSTTGVTVGPLLGERIYLAQESLAATWRTLLYASCAVYAFCGLMRLLFLREVHGRGPEQGRLVIPWGRLAVPMIVTTLSLSAFYLTTDGPLMGPYIVDEAGGTPATVQKVGFYGGLGAIAAAVLAGFLTDRLGAGRTMVATSAATAALLLVFASGWAPRPAEVWIFSMLFLPGEMYTVAYQKLITSIGPRERRGLAVGVVGTVVGLIASWSMVAGGVLYAQGHRLPLVLAAAAQGAGALLGLALLRKIYN